MWFKTSTVAENESFQVLSQKLIPHFESNSIPRHLRQILEEPHRHLSGETVTDYHYDILSVCTRLNLPKSEWPYCFVRGLRPEIRDHAILQQPTDVDSIRFEFFEIKRIVCSW